MHGHQHMHQHRGQHMGPGQAMASFNWRSDTQDREDGGNALFGDTPPGPLSALLAGKTPPVSPLPSTLSPGSRTVGGRGKNQPQPPGAFNTLNPYAPAFLAASLGGTAPSAFGFGVPQETATTGGATGETQPASSTTASTTAAADKPETDAKPSTDKVAGEEKPDGEGGEEDEEGKKRLTWRDLKSGKEWRAIDWDAMPEDERAELWDRMEERTALELSTDSQEALQAAFKIPFPDWQTLGKFIYLRSGQQDDVALPGGRKLGDEVQITLVGVGQNPRLVALKFDGIETEYGGPGATPHVVLYKSQCTRQEESQHIHDWRPPPKHLILQGTIKKIWRLKQQKRNNPNRKKKGKGGFGEDGANNGQGMVGFGLPGGPNPAGSPHWNNHHHGGSGGYNHGGADFGNFNSYNAYNQGRGNFGMQGNYYHQPPRFQGGFH
eukprot:TRINITY_DN53469_c0_g1_i1.p1 TRINITY_DN53469_c0_g1~~TRINITY_DN53469_c0_g1_i1.p1  ORF type:complete len:487 (+),score=81.44 TRINITY_DN53469_c0_g1_i1:155-1462(+)